MVPTSKGWLRALGPGLLFAAAAVGVSHLVQSTRAGASYGLALISLVILANLIKYPAFRFGPHYSAATGTSLLEGYRRQGRAALLLYAALTLGTMFTVQAAVTVVTAGLAIATFGLTIPTVAVAAALLTVCTLLLAIGRYHWLDRITKVLVTILTISTLIATIAAVPRIDWNSASWLPAPELLDHATLLFMAALVGWMPSAIDVSVWQSLWTLARRNDTGHAPSLREAMTDFHIGYVGTALFAVCFLIMGAGVLHGQSVHHANSAGAFAAQVISMYTTTLGAWSGPVVGLAALAVMFSTTLTVLDGFPRALATLVARFTSTEDPGRYEMDHPRLRRLYWTSLALLVAGSLAVLGLLLTSLEAMVDIATTLSFLTAPLLSILNHRAVLGPDVPTRHRPRPWLVAMSIAGITAQTIFALYYLKIQYLSSGS